MLENVQKIHCLGIGGIGVSALAQFFAAQGKQVTGYDDAFPSLGDGVPPLSGGIDLVVYSDSVPEDHPQRVAGREREIPEMSYAQALGQISRDYKTIVVAGTHGKSTTTAMLGLIFEAAGLDPLVIVGTKVPGWKYGNLRLPKDYTNNLCYSRGEANSCHSYLIVEGDDYRDHFLELNPYTVVVTNIEHDHPDYFRDLAHTVESFKELIEKVPERGIVVLNQDDAGCKQLQQQIGHPAILQNRRITIYSKGGVLWDELQLQVPGEFNKYNALAAATCAREFGVADEIVKKALGEFKGVWRRFEIVGVMRLGNAVSQQQGSSSARLKLAADAPNVAQSRYPAASFGKEEVLIISDYGHHPTAIRETMKAAREVYPDRRLILVYQPHQHSRTKRLFNDFVEVLKDAADVVIVSEIYAVKGRMEEKDVSSAQLIEDISRLRNREIYKVLYGGDLIQTEKLVRDTVQEGDVVIIMGAGDIDSLARGLCEERK